MDHTKSQRGFALPLVVLVSAILFIILAIVSMQNTNNGKKIVNMVRQFKAESLSDKGTQRGLNILNQRLGMVEGRIAYGFQKNGSNHLITNDDIAAYINTPSLFWTQVVNNTNMTDQPDFTATDNNTASYTVDTASYTILIEVLSGFELASIEQIGSSGFNNVILRYGYRITSTEKNTGINRKTTIQSPLRTDNISNLIQVHLARELSRYNLFSENNTMQDGTVLYDLTSYGGAVYSMNTFYPAGHPTYNGTVQISNLANPPFWHKDLHSSFVFVNSVAGANPPVIVAPLTLPNSTNIGAMKAICHKGNLGQNPNAETVPGIYVGTETINGVVVPVSIYSNAVNTTLRIDVPTNGQNRYVVTNVDLGISTTVIHKVSDSRLFLFFADGNLSVQGTIAEDTQITMNAKDNILFTNDFRYQSGTLGPITVAGFVSWNGNILVSKSIPPDSGSIKNLSIYGVFMSINGGFGSEGYQDFTTNYPAGYVGTISHRGAFLRKWALPTLSEDGSHGWGLITQYDTFLAQEKAPPYFPGNGLYKLTDTNLCKVIEVYTQKR